MSDNAMLPLLVALEEHLAAVERFATFSANDSSGHTRRELVMMRRQLERLISTVSDNELEAGIWREQGGD